ncbi:MAG: hypothetical protein J1F23_08335 [Oscillospiraceae bacterium]|nr:hypothetical protein [Oscillospiraceae bacterium]
MKYIIDEVPPSNNLYIGRNDRWKYQYAKKYWEDLVRIRCRPRPLEPIDKAIVTLTYFFKNKQRRDPDNYSGKMILDGLVRAGIIADDSFDHITLVIKCGGVSNPPYTEIEVVEQTNEAR